MKKIIFLFVVFLLFLFSCKNNENQKLPDVVTSFTNHDWSQDVDSVITKIESSTTVEEAKVIVSQSSLAKKIREMSPGVEKMRFSFLSPSGDTLTVEDTLGNKIQGFIDRKRLVVTLFFLHGDSKTFFVACMNGLLTPVNGEEVIGEEVYYLATGEGPIHHGATWEELWDMVSRFNKGKTCKDNRLFFHAYRKNGRRVLVDLSTLKKVKRRSKKFLIKLSLGGCNPSTRHQLPPGSRFIKKIDGFWEFIL